MSLKKALLNKYFPFSNKDIIDAFNKDGVISLYNLSYGHIAVYIKIGEYFHQDVSKLKNILKNRMIKDNENYYAYSLYLLTIL